jgi:hypothetical protein
MLAIASARAASTVAAMIHARDVGAGRNNDLESPFASVP